MVEEGGCMQSWERPSLESFLIKKDRFRVSAKGRMSLQRRAGDAGYPAPCGEEPWPNSLTEGPAGDDSPAASPVRERSQDFIDGVSCL